MASMMTIKEFQATFGLSRSTVYRLRDRGEISFRKIGSAVRIPRQDAEDWYETLPTQQGPCSSNSGK